MSDHDLEIDNYDLEDLLDLYKLDYNFDESDLKKAWKRCLKTHPDKSGLDTKYFIFYKKAFKVISEIFHFRSRRKDTNTEYSVEENESERKLLDPIQKNKKEFNKWFNDMFDKIRIADNEQDGGYEEWFRSGSESVEKPRIPLSQFAKEFYKRKKESGMLVKHRGISEINNSVGSSLTRDKIDEYSSDIFSKLKYEDLKKAHTETLIPVTKDDVELRPKFADLDSYKRHRDSNKISPLSVDEAREYLSNKANKEGKANMMRAFKMYKQDEEMEKARDQWWKYIKQLKNE
jgi:hypothetical protein